ncbi:MAG: DUF3168 domain-containing protein [Gammaproteobacteria bacterium]|nr:DUF3168 domain-containing protein [Gammaproteobacteria bacterium]
MAIEGKIYTELTGSTLVNIQTSNRIYPMILPQEPILPAITYERRTGGQVNHLGGYANIENPLIQIDIWSTSYGTSKNLAENVHTVMNSSTSFRSLLITDDDLYEDETKTYIVSMDFSCWNPE